MQMELWNQTDYSVYFIDLTKGSLLTKNSIVAIEKNIIAYKSDSKIQIVLFFSQINTQLQMCWSWKRVSDN